MKVGVSLLVPVLLFALPSAACRKDADEPATNAKPAANANPLPEAKMIPNRDEPLIPADELVISLPEPPKAGLLDPPDVPLRYDDGAYSIKGLRHDFDAQIQSGEAGSDVTVRAFVKELHPSPGCTSGPDCRQAHLFATDERDTQGRRFALLIGAYAFDLEEHEAELWADEPEVVLTVGQQFLFKGKFVRFSDSGFHDERGVLQFTAYQDPAGEWVYPKGADWHPKAVAMMAEQEAQMRARFGR